MRITHSFQHFVSDIKIQHSVFALPFALAAFWVADLSSLSSRLLGLIIVSMVFARSFAMGINRILDAKIDQHNPRTKNRAIPAQRLNIKEAVFWTCVSALGFVISAFLINRTAGWCSFGVLALFTFYPFWKRFSFLAHWYLGLCLGLAPIAVGVAMDGRIEPNLVVLGLGVLFWTAGFDIIYALQDESFDKEHGLRSIPSRFGRGRSLWVSRASFFISIIALSALGLLSQKGLIYFVGVGFLGGVFFLEHVMLATKKPINKRINFVFINLNALVSLSFLVFLLLDYYIGAH